MIGYETEEQQIQAIKKFWKDNGIAILVGACVGLGLLFGWRYYNDMQITNKEAASSAFEESIQAFISDQNTDQLSAFLTEQPDTGYAPLAAMIIAQQAVEKEDYAAAKDSLIKVTTGDSSISDIARLRLANLHIQLEEHDEAIKVLDQVQANEFSGQVEELRGDALLAKGDFDAAKDAYTLAIAQIPNDQNLKMKRDNIAYAKTKAQAQAQGESLE
jgi:predicted negative regulator of RcsB-dependent stress response